MLSTVKLCYALLLHSSLLYSLSYASTATLNAVSIATTVASAATAAVLATYSLTPSLPLPQIPRSLLKVLTSPFSKPSLPSPTPPKPVTLPWNVPCAYQNLKMKIKAVSCPNVNILSMLSALTCGSSLTLTAHFVEPLFSKIFR